MTFGTKAALALVAVVALSGAKQPKPAPLVLSCNAPVRHDDTAASLKRRYGGNAAITRVAGAEGQQVPAVVLWPGNPRRRLEVFFFDEQMTRLSDVLVRDPASRWQVGGLRLGDPLTKVEALNGRWFNVNGFEWDYGGYVDLRGGTLQRQPGGCMASIRMTLQQNGRQNGPALDTAILGETKVSSQDPRLRQALPVISELAIGWSLK